MIDLEKVKVRAINAIEQFPQYIQGVVQDGHNFVVANKYKVDLDLATCSCRDNEIRGDETPCKHIITVWLYIYAEKRQQPHPF